MIGGAGMDQVLALQRVSAQAEVREGARRGIAHDPPMINQLLKFRGGLFASMRLQISIAAHENGVHAPNGQTTPEIVRACRLQFFDGFIRIVAAHFNTGMNHRQPDRSAEAY